MAVVQRSKRKGDYTDAFLKLLVRKPPPAVGNFTTSYEMINWARMW